MADPEEIAHQQKLLTTHRRNLAHSLQQQAELGVHTPPYVASEIFEARSNIQRSKQLLRGWHVAVEDFVIDSDLVPPPGLPPLGLQQQFLCYAARDGAGGLFAGAGQGWDVTEESGIRSQESEYEPTELRN
jgi:hypothetical protein